MIDSTLLMFVRLGPQATRQTVSHCRATCPHLPRPRHMPASDICACPREKPLLRCPPIALPVVTLASSKFARAGVRVLLTLSLCLPSDVDTRTIGSRYRLEQPQQKTTTSINLAPGLDPFSSSHRRSPPQKNQPPTMSKLSASSVRTTVKTLLLQSSLEGQATKNDDGSTVGKKRNFVETIELQIGLKNYDPQRDKRFVSLPG